MKQLSRLLQIAKRELNHLYTEPPSERNGGLDEGWFCREHAYHTHFLLRMFGHDSTIEVGHFAIRSGASLNFTSYGTDADHAWCRMGEFAPIDLSMNLEFRPNMPQLTGAIMGDASSNGHYSIHYFGQEAAFEAWLDSPIQGPAIGFFPQPFADTDDATLLDNPASFFLPSGENGWMALYGAEVFCRITMHIYKVVSGQVPPLSDRFESRIAFQHIRKNYKASRRKIANLLRL